MSVESVLIEATIAGIRVVPADGNLKVRGPAFAVSVWAPRLRQHRSDIEARISAFTAKIERARSDGLLGAADAAMAMRRCADPAAWRLWECVIAGAEAGRGDGCDR